MNQLASLLSLALGIVAITIGAQRALLNEAMASVAEHLGVPKQNFRILGALQVLLAIGLLASLKGHKGGLDVLSMISAGAGVIVFGLELLASLRAQSSRNIFLGLLTLVVASAVVLILRIAG